MSDNNKCTMLINILYEYCRVQNNDSYKKIFAICKGLYSIPFISIDIEDSEVSLNFIDDDFLYGEAGKVNILALNRLFASYSASIYKLPYKEIAGLFTIDLTKIIGSCFNLNDLDNFFLIVRRLKSFYLSDDRFLDKEAEEEYASYFNNVIDKEIKAWVYSKPDWTAIENYSVLQNYIVNWLNDNAVEYLFDLDYDHSKLEDFIDSKLHIYESNLN